MLKSVASYICSILEDAIAANCSMTVPCLNLFVVTVMLGRRKPAPASISASRSRPCSGLDHTPQAQTTTVSRPDAIQLPQYPRDFLRNMPLLFVSSNNRICPFPFSSTSDVTPTSRHADPYHFQLHNATSERGPGAIGVNQISATSRRQRLPHLGHRRGHHRRRPHSIRLQARTSSSTPAGNRHI
jgi:hypothetical protein